MDFDINALIANVAGNAVPIPEKVNIDGTEIMIGPRAGGGFQIESLEKYRDELRDAPKRRKGVAKVNTLASFIDLVSGHKDEDSVIFASLDGQQQGLTAVIDYSTAVAPRFGQHRVTYPFPFSDEWKAWTARDNGVFNQSDWGVFIEDRVADLASPTDGEDSEYARLFQTKFASPAEMMQLSRGLSLTVEAQVGEFRILQSGEAEITYNEVHKDHRGEKLVVPGLFVVNIPIFVDTAPSRFVARLRYRKKEGRILWFYSLYRARETVRSAMKEAMDEAAAQTGLPAFEGTPEA